MVNPVPASLGKRTRQVLRFLIITPPKVVATPDGDFGQPILKWTGPLKTSQGLVGLDKDVVGHFRHLLPWNMVPDNASYIILVSLYQNFEGVNIAPESITDNRGIVRSIVCEVHLDRGINKIVAPLEKDDHQRTGNSRLPETV
jgi:hypothetical protein